MMYIRKMKKIMPSLTFVSLFIWLMLIVVIPVEAQIETIDSSITSTTTGIGIADGTLEDFIVNIVDKFLFFASIIAVIFLIYGGFKYMTSAGDNSQAESAKKTIMYAIVGLIVIGLSWAIISFVIDAIQNNPPPADD